MDARTGEIHVRQDHVHEDVGLSPDDGEGESDSASSQEGDVENPPGEHQRLRRHAAMNVRNCGSVSDESTGSEGGNGLVLVGDCGR